MPRVTVIVKEQESLFSLLAEESVQLSVPGTEAAQVSRGMDTGTLLSFLDI